jgi:hypothetical protein
MMNDISNNLMENRRNISSLHILLIVILLTVDYYSAFRYGIEFKSIKYLINYQELLIINTTIIGISTLLFILSRKIPVQFFVVLFIIFFMVLYRSREEDFFDFINKSFLEVFFVTCIIFFSIFGVSRIYNWIIEFADAINKWLSVFLALIITMISTFLLSTHYESLNDNWNKIVVKDNIYTFPKYNLFQMMFNQKIFSPNRLEELQTNVTFKDSELYVNRLKSFGILENNILEYNNDKLNVKYIINQNYKIFFIIKKVKYSTDNTTEMFIVYSEKDKNKEEYQIINVQEKSLSFEYK